MKFSELIEKAKQKDEKAIGELFESTSKKGYFVALKYLKNKEDAQDILQDAYVSALSKLDSLKNPEKFDKWLYQIIANKAKNYLVKNKPLLFEQLEKEDEDAVQFEETIQDDTLEFQPKENCDYQELKKALKVLIDELPEDQRMCLLMYYFEELSINEISESLELNTNTIKSRLNYARKKIKDKVEELQKQGTHLYGVAPIPFLLWMLQEEAQAISVPHISINFLFSQVAKESGKAVTKQGITILGKTMSVKAITISAISAVVIFGGGTAYYQYTQEQHRQAIYDSLSIQFTDENVLEYGSKLESSSLIKEHTGDTIKQLNELDTTKVGTQTIQYLISKAGIERTFEITVEVKDTKPPVLSLTEESIDLTIGDEFDPKVYIKEAKDEIDGELLDQVEINDSVDTSVVGEYEVTYSLKDKNDLITESTLKVTVMDKKIVQQKQETSIDQPTHKEETQIETDTRVTVGLDHLGVSMKVPSSFEYRNVALLDPSVVGAETYRYVANIGSEGLIMDVYYFPYNDYFNNSLEGSHGLRMRTLENYAIARPQVYEAYDRGSYIVAIKQGIDYPISGTAWVAENDNESMSIRIEGKADNSGVYAINLRANNLDRGYSLGVDGFKEERIKIAREIFNSIQ